MKRALILLLTVFIATSIQLDASMIGKKLTDRQGIFYQWEEYSLNLRVVDNFFQLYFVDKKGEVVAPPIQSASIRWEGPMYVMLRGKKVMKLKSEAGGTIRTREGDLVLLELGPESDSLVSTRYVPPRTTYWVFLTLFKTIPNSDKLDPIGTFQRTQLLINTTDNEK